MIDKARHRRALLAAADGYRALPPTRAARHAAPFGRRIKPGRSMHPRVADLTPFRLKPGRGARMTGTPACPARYAAVAVRRRRACLRSGRVLTEIAPTLYRHRTEPGQENLYFPRLSKAHPQRTERQTPAAFAGSISRHLQVRWPLRQQALRGSQRACLAGGRSRFRPPFRTGRQPDS